MEAQDVKLLIGELDSSQSRFANKALDYYDGKQLTHMVNLLNHPHQGRKDWQTRGMRACYRNITGSIVEKSGLLFINGRPDILLEDVNGAEVDDETFALHQILNDSHFEEVMSNFDSVVRLLKTAGLLTQYESESQTLVFDILHRGNSAVRTSGLKRTVTQLLYKTGEDSKGTWYRTYDLLVVQDWYVENNGTGAQLMSEIENPYGMIPFTVFHDTHMPREGFWNYIPQDLVLFNEEYNLYLVDILYAASYANRKTLYTNASFAGDGGTGGMEVQEFYGEALPRQVQGSGSLTAGPDKIIQIDTTGVDNVFMQYMGPEVALEEIRKLFMSLTKDIAADWSVRVKIEGEGTASSGFQVVVEEMDNLELRKQRQKFMTSGMVRLIDTARSIINISEGTQIFDESAAASIEFSKPSLPVDDYKDDEMWIKRIESGLASRADYMMSKYNMSRDQAIEYLALIDQERNSNVMAS